MQTKWTTMMAGALGVGLMALGTLGSTASAQAELLTNPGFEDVDLNGNQGDGWGSFGAAGFNAFFGPNGHASLFMDNPGNSGGVFQTGVAATPGLEYRFDLLDVRIESNAAATVLFGLEWFEADDATKLGEALAPVSLATTGDGLSFSMTATAPSGTAFARPILRFDNVTSTANGQENLFVFDSSLTVVPEPGSAALLGLGGLVLARRRRSIGA